MNKKGFTLVEILVVIVLMTLIAGISYAGVSAVKNNINNNLWKSTVTLIENGAKNYGIDNQNLLENNGNEMVLSVQELIDKGYIKTKEENEEGKKILVDNRKKEGEEDYVLNNKTVRIYLENYRVYADFNE